MNRASGTVRRVTRTDDSDSCWKRIEMRATHTRRCSLRGGISGSPVRQPGDRLHPAFRYPAPRTTACTHYRNSNRRSKTSRYGIDTRPSQARIACKLSQRILAESPQALFGCICRVFPHFCDTKSCGRRDSTHRYCGENGHVIFQRLQRRHGSKPSRKSDEAQNCLCNQRRTR